MRFIYLADIGGGDGPSPEEKERLQQLEQERLEALREAEEKRLEKHRKMEAERETMRQGIRDKVRIDMIVDVNYISVDHYLTLRNK